MWQNIEGLLFDKDGTLFDYQATWGAWAVAVAQQIAPESKDLQNNLLEAAGMDLQAGSFVAGGVLVAGTSDDLFACWSQVLPSLTMNRLEEIGLKELERVPTVPVCDLPDVLTRLHSAGIRLGVATNDYEASAVKQLTDAGVVDLFDVILGYDSGPIPKPEPDMVFEFCKRTAIEPDRISMIGDSTHDLDAGRAAGVRTIGVLTGPADAAGLAAADKVLPNIAALPDLLGLPS